MEAQLDTLTPNIVGNNRSLIRDTDQFEVIPTDNKALPRALTEWTGFFEFEIS